jgi:hypothetical protein
MNAADDISSRMRIALIESLPLRRYITACH